VGTSHNPTQSLLLQQSNTQFLLLQPGNPYSFGRTILTPEATRQGTNIYTPQFTATSTSYQSAVAITPIPGTNSGINMGVQTCQSQSLPRLQQDHSKSTSPAIANQEQRIYSSSDRQLAEPGRTAIFSANPALLQPASPGQHTEARPAPQSPPAETSRLRPELADIFRMRIRPFSGPAIQSCSDAHTTLFRAINLSVLKWLSHVHRHPTLVTPT
jgi:hypothetical protein